MLRRPEHPSDWELLNSIENAFVSIAAQSKPAIVGVVAMDVHRAERLPRLEGSGFIFREDGYILTNDHIVRGARHLRVKLLDGSTLEAKLVGTDVSTDIAVLKVDREEPFPMLKLADSAKVRGRSICDRYR